MSQSIIAPSKDVADTETETLAALYEAGLAHEDAGRRDAAVEAYRAALARDPVDRAGIALRLAALGAAPPPDRAPPAYVSMLFDEHADAFDERLVRDLRYAVPQMMRRVLESEAPGPHGRMLDLGCGTGLAAAALEGLYGTAIGLDISAGMLRAAAARGLYRTLVLGDALPVLRGWKGRRPVDLVVAADVLIYFGELPPILGAVAAVLRPGGHLILSTETRETEPAPGWRYAVANGRFAHAEGYLAGSLAGAGLDVLAFARARIRLQADRPVPGNIVLARRPG